MEFISHIKSACDWGEMLHFVCVCLCLSFTSQRALRVYSNKKSGILGWAEDKVKKSMYTFSLN